VLNTPNPTPVLCHASKKQEKSTGEASLIAAARGRIFASTVMTEILYVSDLDGTLLQEDATVSPTSRRILSSLLAEGLPLTVASARSVVSMQQMLAGIGLKLPVIEFNGAFLSDLDTGKHTWICALEPQLSVEILAAIRACGHTPFVSTFDGERDRLYCGASQNPGMDWYIHDRQQSCDDRLTPVTDVGQGLADQIVCFTVIDREAPLRSLETQLKGGWGSQIKLHNQENRYFPGWFWLTVHHLHATKDRAVSRLLSQLDFVGAEVVAFGDEENDMGLFDLADRPVAVANAIPALKERATEVIGPNTQDSVALYLQADWRARCERRG
jgi:Cof subfamily protein (haloacid dehalogenase superfamily)